MADFDWPDDESGNNRCAIATIKDYTGTVYIKQCGDFSTSTFLSLSLSTKTRFEAEFFFLHRVKPSSRQVRQYGEANEPIGTYAMQRGVRRSSFGC